MFTMNTHGTNNKFAASVSYAINSSMAQSLNLNNLIIDKISTQPCASNVSPKASRCSIADADACGDSTRHRCAVCRRMCSQRRMSDLCQRKLHVEDSGQASYTSLIGECFGIEISPPPDAVICSSCVHQMRKVQQFKDQIITASQRWQDKRLNSLSSKGDCYQRKTRAKLRIKVEAPVPPPSLSSLSSKTDSYNRKKRAKLRTKVAERIPPPDFPDPLDQPLQNYTNKGILKFVNRKLNVQSLSVKEKSKQERPEIRSKEDKMKRTLAYCLYCGQRYPMAFWPVAGSKTVPTYVCARCKLNKGGERETKCRICSDTVDVLKMNEHMERHTRYDESEKMRLHGTREKSCSTVTRLPSGSQKSSKVKASVGDYREALQSVLSDLREEFGIIRPMKQQEKVVDHGPRVCDRGIRLKPILHRRENNKKALVNKRIVRSL